MISGGDIARKGGMDFSGGDWHPSAHYDIYSHETDQVGNQGKKMWGAENV